ncbi:MAG: ASKHA domain-containing protein [Bacillota bacterium]|nr:ASKHA domain-containing protein [Bacillota bacterium]
MNIINNFDLNIEESEILRLLGYKKNQYDEEIIINIKEQIQNSKIYLQPQIWFEKIEIDKIYKDKVILKNSTVLNGEYIADKLKSCEYIIVSISTLGFEIDAIIEAAFEAGDYLKGMIIDNIGVTALNYINKFFWNSLLNDIESSNIGITQRLSPGDGSWQIEEQKKIFDCFKDSDINVKLLNSFLMTPIKSSTIIYGFGKDIGITRIDHTCSECNMKNCRYKAEEIVQVKVNIDNKIVSLKAFKGQSLHKVLVENNIPIQNPCSGKGICGKCRVLITKGIENWSKTDEAHITLPELKKGIRLACCYKVTGDIELTILTKEENINVLTEGQKINIKINPAVKKYFLQLTLPSLNDQKDDLARLGDVYQLLDIRDGYHFSDIKINYNVLSNLSETLRKDNFNVTAAIYKNNLIAVESGDTTDILFGAAIDIGTTTIACYLINMQNGKTIDASSQVNSQRAYGADVISRINYTIENVNGSKILKDSIVNQINELLEILYRRNNLDSKSIYHMTIAGNTTMLHMLLGISCRNISMSPYIPSFTNGFDIDASDLGINICGTVNLLPGISSYVGSDIVADMLAVEIIKTEKYSLILDLGTNGEIVLGNNQGISACAAAAGPAFEGTNIKNGIGGVNGAISKIDLSKTKKFETIGNASPIGICGSGVLDAVSELLKHGIIDETGRMLDANEINSKDLSKKIILIDGIKHFIIAEETENNSPIYFTQKDVREVQLAKASIYAGIKILMKEQKINYDQIETVYIAGGFGNFMDIKSSINIGMIPKELEGKIYSIGNGAGTGAKKHLLSTDQESLAQQIKTKTKYIELSAREDFQELFMNSMMFKYIII